MGSSQRSSDATEVETLVSGPLGELGLDVEAVEITPAGKRRVLRIAVDKDGGVSLDDVAAATKAVNGVLDATTVMGDQPYTLEVTSPGVDRPLTRPRHWRRAWLRLASIRLTDGSELSARVGRADDDGVRVAIPGKRPEVRDLRYGEIAGARVEVEFRDPPTAEVALLDPTSHSPENGNGEDR